MARKSLQLRRKSPLPKGRLVLKMTNRDYEKWDMGEEGVVTYSGSDVKYNSNSITYVS